MKKRIRTNYRFYTRKAVGRCKYTISVTPYGLYFGEEWQLSLSLAGKKAVFRKGK